MHFLPLQEKSTMSFLLYEEQSILQWHYFMNCIIREGTVLPTIVTIANLLLRLDIIAPNVM